MYPDSDNFYRVMNKLGFKTKGLRIGMDGLTSVKLSAIYLFIALSMVVCEKRIISLSGKDVVY